LKTISRRIWGIRAFSKKAVSAGVTHYLAYYLDKELEGCNSVLDLGCGQSSWLKVCSVPYSLGVDIFEPSLKESIKRKLHNEYLLADVRDLEFKDRTFDAVIAFEVIEHLTKEEGRKLLSSMERWARKKVIISTPNGHVHQSQVMIEFNPHQRHMSGWDISELNQLGFKVKGACGWRVLWTNEGKMRFRPEIIWQTITSLTSIILYNFPQVSFDLFCVKTL
jgi:ubiquinone/menaquinone biosynthesis C-methylase UbiE